MADDNNGLQLNNCHASILRLMYALIIGRVKLPIIIYIKCPNGSMISTRRHIYLVRTIRVQASNPLSIAHGGAPSPYARAHASFTENKMTLSQMATDPGRSPDRAQGMTTSRKPGGRADEPDCAPAGCKKYFLAGRSKLFPTAAQFTSHAYHSHGQERMDACRCSTTDREKGSYLTFQKHTRKRFPSL